MRHCRSSCVSKSTLGRRVKGGRSIREFNATKQLLSTAEETVLVQFILESADREFPLNHDLIKLYVNAIIISRAGANADMCGTKWIFGFLD